MVTESISTTGVLPPSAANHGNTRGAFSLLSLCLALTFVWLVRHGVAVRFTSPAIFLTAAAGIYVSLVAMFISRFRSPSPWLGLVFNLAIAEFWVILRFIHVM